LPYHLPPFDRIQGRNSSCRRTEAGIAGASFKEVDAIAAKHRQGEASTIPWVALERDRTNLLESGANERFSNLKTLPIPNPTRQKN